MVSCFCVARKVVAHAFRKVWQCCSSSRSCEKLFVFLQRCAAMLIRHLWPSCCKISSWSINKKTSDSNLLLFLPVLVTVNLELDFCMYFYLSSYLCLPVSVCFLPSPHPGTRSGNGQSNFQICQTISFDEFSQATGQKHKRTLTAINSAQSEALAIAYSTCNHISESPCYTVHNNLSRG